VCQSHAALKSHPAETRLGGGVASLWIGNQLKIQHESKIIIGGTACPQVPMYITNN
jgi:hypothetical protein